MECADGQKGGKDLICPDLDSAAVKKIAINADIAVKEKERAKAAEAMKDAEEDLAKQTGLTIVISLILGIIITVVDSGALRLIDWILTR